MAKAKIKKQDTFIDMTAMSDVTVLLLCFFMLTSSFVKDEPVKVTTPASVSDKAIPQTNLMTILVDEKGKLFLNFTDQNDKIKIITAVGDDFGITFTQPQLNAFRKMDTFGVPIRSAGAFLDLPSDQQDKFLKDLENRQVGIPTDSLPNGKNEFQHWVIRARETNDNLQIAIKADKSTNYPVVKTVIDNLRALRENRYLLITSLKTASNT